MITYRTGDATSPQTTGPAIIAHICNDAGYWGKGFELAVSARWPTTRTRFLEWASGDGDARLPFTLGQTQYVTVHNDPTILVANMVAQHGIRRHQTDIPLRYDALAACLRSVSTLATFCHASIHLPRLGCGLAGGTWEHVEPLLRHIFCAKHLSVTVYDLPSI